MQYSILADQYAKSFYLLLSSCKQTFYYHNCSKPKIRYCYFFLYSPPLSKFMNILLCCSKTNHLKNSYVVW